MPEPTSPPKRAALFDLDGTLVDSMPFVVESFIHAVEPFRARPSEQEVLGHLGGPLEVCLRNVLGASAADSFDEAKERLFKYESGKEALLKPFEGARDLLTALQGRGIPMGIWTGRDRWSAERVLKIHGLARFFGSMVCGDDLPSHKPDPAGLRRAIELLGATPVDSVFLGDADVDVIGGHAAGVHTIFLHHGRKAAMHVQDRATEIFECPREAYSAVIRHFI